MKRVVGDVGKAGVAVDSVLDMEILFNKIQLDRISVSMTMNGASTSYTCILYCNCFGTRCYLEQLAGTIQNDILKEYMESVILIFIHRNINENNSRYF